MVSVVPTDGYASGGQFAFHAKTGNQLALCGPPKEKPQREIDA
jgi:hypothetical protein